MQTFIDCSYLANHRIRIESRTPKIMGFIHAARARSMEYMIASQDKLLTTMTALPYPIILQKSVKNLIYLILIYTISFSILSICILEQ